MSRLLIQNYHTEVEKIIQYGGSSKETSIRVAFQNLLNAYCIPKNFILIPELAYPTKYDTTVYPDGTVKDALRLDWGYWESKDKYDDLDKEIRTKFAKGYPNDNILFEDSQQAILIQGNNEVSRVSIADAAKLDALLNKFINYERREVRDFRQAIEKFKADLPTVVDTLRSTIANQKALKFKAAFKKLFNLCKESINPKINEFDIQEMIIQHILTEDIFLTVFNESQFHRENVIAKELESVVNTFFIGSVRRDTLKSIESYYAVIRRKAADISNHHEKQKFLKVIYENFYKAYNPKGADRLGIVYTPNEIVQFMIRSTDYLLDKHFNRLLSDDNVSILDPATGTGTFITELIEYLPKSRLPAKYKNEIHCNEVSILPYYIANLNIEYTYQQKMGKYEEFGNICFVDTLDNVGFEHGTGYKHQQSDLSLGLGAENAKRIEEQNQRKISVIIGNPPYNANQQNENDNNKNREYPEIDNDIKRTYIENSTAQKTKMYDMYTRFLRWASNRIDKNGVIAFVSNSSFLEARTYDGFRKVIAEEFNAIYAIDLKGNARTTGERRRKESGNVFSDAIRVGIAVYFLIKDENSKGCKIYYNAIRDYAKAEEKKEYLRDNTLDSLNFERITPDKNHNWLNLADNDFDDLLPLANKETKLAKSQKEEQAVFKLFSQGIKSNRDDWVYDFDRKNVVIKMQRYIAFFNSELNRLKEIVNDENISDLIGYEIKWTRALKKQLLKRMSLLFQDNNIRKTHFRPFVRKYIYHGKVLNEDLYQTEQIFVKTNEVCICISGIPSNKQHQTLVIKNLVDYHFLEDTQIIPFYRYDSEGNRTDNITNWGLNQFQNHYQDNTITKENIFHYTYAVLHNPAYRQKYELNLKREFPRLPFYEDFSQWVNWGKQLMDLHLNYEKAKKYKLKQIDIETNKQNKPKLKADKEAGKIHLDQITTLQGIPASAWDYKLGNRSALEWILDQYKEKKPRDKTIAEKFNTYRFADYKEHVIDLLKRVCTVSVETIKIIEEMPI
ncbi:type ISP restriction/modification enzyme [Candidatus Parabeggiatoa sp. HSG14]|uniref:type ISP restriction/modification enzyme n=1 Tax=Candidatus Parabeggiatoa sp. HSG14 TaxID=3055593 RepID=UPI0025A8A95D|nr:N-6 DNA methylase [Thiotrichales bacterium HSG14]